MEKFHKFLLENGFEFQYKTNNEANYYYTKVVEGIDFVYCLTAPHEGTRNRYLLRAETEKEFDRWSIARFMRFYKDFNDFKENWGKYLFFDESDEMYNS